VRDTVQWVHAWSQSELVFAANLPHNIVNIP